jgi:general secretion pathway protein A
MYLKYYGLKLKPFEINPDPRFLWLGGHHKEALGALTYGILEDKGFLSLTGDTGTGKTTLVNALEKSLGDNIIFGKISDPSLEESDFLKMIADALEMNKKFSSKGTFLIHLKHFLNDAHADNKEVVLVIEEAQRLNEERLEQIRLLSNIGRSDKNLLTIIFVGQNEFIKTLNENEALKQRVTIIHKIKPLQDAEAGKYIRHRLKEAGSDKKIFCSSAIREIFSFSEGNPRLINIICDLALLTGCEKKVKFIKSKIVRECADILRLSHQSGKDEIEKEKAIANTIYENITNGVRAITTERRIPHLASAALILLVFVFGFYFYLSDYGDSSINTKTYSENSLRGLNNPKSNTLLQNSDKIVKFQGDSASSKIKLLDFNTPKAEEDIQFDKLESEYENIQADLMELKNTQKRVAELENAAVKREQLLSQSEQKITQLTTALDQEKKSKELLQTELSSKVASVAELKEKLETSESNAVKFGDDVEKRTEEITKLQNQMQDLEAEKNSSETQLAVLQTKYNKLQSDLKELKSTQERVAELENAAVKREQLITQSEQKITQLSAELEQEKKSNEMLQAELSAKVASVSELKEKLETSESNAVKFGDDVEKRTEEITKLQNQMQDLETQKNSSETQLAVLQTEYNKLQADLMELKSTQERIAELENVSLQRERLLSQSEQKLTSLASLLEQEKKNNELLQAELSSKVASITELQEKLETSNSNSLKFENEVEKSKQEIKELQSQLMKFEVQKASPESSEVIVEAPEKLPTESIAIESETKSPNPTDIIDWIIKKKSIKKN